MINIICSGKIKEKYLTELIDDYKNRISKYHKINIIEIKDENNLKKEGFNILKYIGAKDYVISCAIDGKEMTSKELANLIDDVFITNSTIDFIIGSSDGLDSDVLKRANCSISFGRFTMPHGLFRGVLMEQIYRAFKINNGENYHK